MLLPSALPCDLLAPQSRCAKRPTLPSFDAFAAQPQLSHTGPGSILASCRALQTVLGAYLPSSISQSQPHLTPQSLQPSPFAPKKLQSPAPQLTPPTRGANKRNRDQFEEDNMPPQGGNKLPVQQVAKDIYQTPKRQCRVPESMPRGLKPSDFHSLYTPPHQIIREQIEIEMPPASTCSPSQPATPYVNTPYSLYTHHQAYNLDESTIQESWSTIDDRRLVEVVLSKLNLSARDWNACAQQLGKDSDTLGRRWNLLVGEGNIGIRKGSGKLHGRTGLDIASW